MSTLLDRPTASQGAADHLRATMAAVRLSFTWLGVRKTLTSQQKSEAAETFGAAADVLSAGKKLLDTSHPAFKAVTAVRGHVVAFVRRITLPYPEPGIRLIRQDDVQAFQVSLESQRRELQETVEELGRHYQYLVNAARERLGRLFNANDYPASLDGMFDMVWDYPSVEPPHYLRELSPELYRQECDRVTARFNEAVQLAEQAFVEELERLISHLTERLSGQEDGKPKIFRDSIVENLSEFFQRFRHLNVLSNQHLDELVGRAQRIVRGVQPQALRDDQTLRQRVATQLARVQSVLDGMLVDRPRRNILRRPAS